MVNLAVTLGVYHMQHTLAKPVVELQGELGLRNTRQTIFLNRQRIYVKRRFYNGRTKRDARRIQMSDYDALPCAGCGEPPVDIGSFGRVKYACATYTRRDREKVTDRCDGGQGRPSFYLYSSAVSDWNKVQTEDTNE